MPATVRVEPTHCPNRMKLDPGELDPHADSVTTTPSRKSGTIRATKTARPASLPDTRDSLCQLVTLMVIPAL